jgi:hypothetical protein
MSESPYDLRALVQADLPWQRDQAIRGALRIDRDALVLERQGGSPVRIPLQAIVRASIETTLGVMPALHVWHRHGGQEARSRFEFIPEDVEDADDEGAGLADRVGPGLAREAAQRLEGGFRALTGGLKESRRVMRRAVEGVARQDEYRMWPAAIAQAQAAATKHRRPDPSAPTPSAAPPSPIVPEMARVPSGDAAAVLAWFRERAVPWLAAFGERARALGVKDAPVIQPQYPLDSPTCRIVVAGEFSRGKSTVINALFGIHGEIALPTGMTPTTPLACAIRVPSVGEADGATISYRSGRAPQQLSLDDFRARVRLAEEGDAQAADQARQALHLDEARRVEVRITGAYLPAGVEIEDTPGLNEQAGRSAGALAALGRADLILFVLAADQLLGDLEREVIERTLAQGHHRNVLFLVNFWDTIEDEAQRQILRQRAEALLRDFPSPFGAAGAGSDPRPMPHIFYISALQAARAQRQRKPAPEESGIPALRAELRDLLGPQSSALLLRARIARALRYLQLLRHAVSRAGAEAALQAEGGRAQRREGDYEAALAAALRPLAGMPGAVEGAAAPALRALREGTTEGLRRLAAPSGAAPGAPPDLQRLLALELRVAAAACGQAAQQAVDLVLAQARAAFLTRGLPAPQIDGRVTPPELVSPGAMPPSGLATLLGSVADAAGAALAAEADRLRAALERDLRQAVAAATGTAEQPASDTSGDTRRVVARQRAASLHALEDDLARLEQLLRPCLRQGA